MLSSYIKNKIFYINTVKILELIYYIYMTLKNKKIVRNLM